MCKAFLTNITDVGALPRVLPHVNLQGLVLRELAVAHRAREPFQAHVAQQVALQVPLHLLFLSQNFKFLINFFTVLRIRIHLIRIRIQHFRLNTDPDPDPIWIQGLDDQKLKKNLQLKKYNYFWIKTTIYDLPIPRPP